eukprot:TRINITY_DN8946_c0_g1_i5.p1 TRINITY_DN8946_c0_g1~~TRINITY_DN8946_c0_g1_i5.p1  ORF type:complete len:250 (-),score=59.86 TRINITY_DN8946_c0_g1_i5:255-1004(-)
MSENLTVVTGSMLDIFITSNITSFSSEKKLDKSMTVGDLKVKLELITGGSASTMTITVFDKDNKLICKLDDDSALLGSFPIDNGHTLHVEDQTRTAGEFENTAAVEKYELTPEEYSKKSDTVQAYLKRNKLGKYNEEEMAALAKAKEDQEKEDENRISSKGIAEGARCQVSVAGQMERRGTVRYVGKPDFQPGWWVGVQYDEPVGKNDGSVNGKRYFTCPAKYGGFVRPNNLEVGDFPEEDLDLSDGEM